MLNLRQKIDNLGDWLHKDIEMGHMKEVEAQVGDIYNHLLGFINDYKNDRVMNNGAFEHLLAMKEDIQNNMSSLVEVQEVDAFKTNLLSLVKNLNNSMRKIV
ncbi:MAG: hypothetical protein U9O94_04535 [Nanoarchaeota archaeon]|nr:hypothetical protein [Nanoarchaeota archaeon]